jgi:hypothetical protein
MSCMAHHDTFDEIDLVTGVGRQIRFTSDVRCSIAGLPIGDWWWVDQWTSGIGQRTETSRSRWRMGVTQDGVEVDERDEPGMN